MAHTTSHDEGAPRRRRDTRSEPRSGEPPRRTPEELAAEAGVDPEELEEEALIRGELDDSLHLHEGDDELETLSSDELYAETPVPDDAHLRDFERQANVQPTPSGPPNHERLTAQPEELGARFLEGITQSDPTRGEEARERDDELATDKELDIRGGDGEPTPEERTARSPSSPAGSPPD